MKLTISGFCVASAIARWNEISDSRARLNVFVVGSMSLRQPDIAFRSLGLRRSAARTAACISTAIRSSKIWRSEGCVPADVASRKGRAFVSFSTKTPLPWWEAIRPSDFSRDRASRTTVMLTPKTSLISLLGGSFRPGSYLPLMISSRSIDVTRSVRLFEAVARRTGLYGIFHVLPKTVMSMAR